MADFPFTLGIFDQFSRIASCLPCIGDNNIVSGRNRITTVSTIKKLCDGLGITIIEFFDCELFASLEQELK